MDVALLDSDILSEVLKQRNSVVRMRAVAYLQQQQRFNISAVSRFEIMRGYKKIKAVSQIARFSNFCQHTNILPITDAIFDCAADLWAFAREHGYPHGDADLLIAATALQHEYMLVTGNTSHFSWISGLKLDDWRTP